MRALTVIPKRADTLELSWDFPRPARRANELLVESVRLGICATDIEICAGKSGLSPVGQERLVIGHESLGRVLEAPTDCAVSVGDLVVGVVRRPDALPCACCAAGEWDMCMNGEYTERGIRGANGYGSELFALDPGFAFVVPPALAELGVLVEPASVVAKAWEQIDRIAARSASLRQRNVLVTGAGPVGLLACLLGVQRGLDVTVLDEADDGIKPELVRSAGARFHSGSARTLPTRPDVVIECSGNERVIADVLGNSAANGITCFVGLSGGGRSVSVSAANLNDALVLQNEVLFGSVNANGRHYTQAIGALVRANPWWLGRMVTRTVPLSEFQAAFSHEAGDVKTVIDMTR